MTTPNPTWYDILGVPRDASPDQIKAAWRDATDKFEPGAGSGQFRLFNEAADVLLDPRRREEYDAGLVDDPGSEAATPPPPPLTPPPASGPSTASYPVLIQDVGERSRRGLLLPVLAVVTALAVVAALVALGMLWKRSSDAGVGLATGIVKGEVPAREAASDTAQSAAARALSAVLSYDYRRMDADKSRALKYLTPSFGKEFGTTFDKLLADAADGKPGNAVKTKTVVKADVLGTGVMNPDAATTSRVRVLAFVNQSATKGDGSPTIFQNRVAVTMVERDGTWLIDDLTSY